MTPVFEDPVALGQRIGEARRRAGFTSQDAFAERLGVSVGTVKRWETGKEESLGKSSAARRTTAVIVAEATGRWDLLDLDQPNGEPSDWLEEARSVRGLVTKLTVDLAALQITSEETQSRLERLEQAD